MENYQPIENSNSKAGKHDGLGKDKIVRIVWADVRGFGLGWYWTKHSASVSPAHGNPHGPFITSEEAYTDYEKSHAN